MEQQPDKEVEGEPPAEGQVDTTSSEPVIKAAVVEATKGVDALGLGGADDPAKSAEAIAAAGAAREVGEDGRIPASQAGGGPGIGAAEEADGKGEASGGDASGGPPGAQEQEQSDDRAVLQVLFEMYVRRRALFIYVARI